MASKEKSFYQRLTRLFRSGPAIRKKIKGQNYKNFYDNQVVQNNLGYYGAAGFKKESSPFSTMGAYGMLDRMSRYAEFSEMESCAEVASALNVYADESCATDENGNTFHIYSDNPQIQKTLEELFYDTVDIEFNGRRMIRNLVKNGDYFMYVEVVPDHGVINAEPLPVNEVEREEGFDKHDPYAVRFRLLQRGGKYLENWQMLHFRILGNDLMMPYGTSFLESARRPWRQLCHLSGTKVLTSSGHKNIEDVTPGETVYTHVPDIKQTIKTRVKHVLDMGVQPIVSVETTHRTIKVTPNHGLLVCDKAGAFLYKKATDLIQSQRDGGGVSRNSDKLVLPAVLSGDSTLSLKFEDLASNYSVKLTREATEIDRKGIIQRIKQLGTATGHKNVHSFLKGTRKLSWADYKLVQAEFDLTTPTEYFYRHSKKKSLFFSPGNHVQVLDKEFVRFFGFMLGDGWVNKNGFGFALGVNDQQNTDHIAYTSKVFGTKHNLTQRPGTRSAQVNWFSTEAADVFRHLGFKTGFANKQIPTWVHELDLTGRRALLRGMFDADGCETTKTICFANKRLIEQTQELCWTIGVPVGKAITIRPERKGHRESYKLWIDLTKPSRDVVYENVLRVVPQVEHGQTWDLEVEHEEHNFLANGVVTHNTMMEDSMLVYRLIRSPERRVFYVDVSAVHPNDIPSYMEAIKESMRGASVIEQQQGRQDFRYNPLPVWSKTPIPLLDGRVITIEQLAAEYESGKTNWVYSTQDNTNEIVPGKVVWCGKNYTAKTLTRVTLDDGTWVMTAPEHPFVLRNGASCRADELTIGQPLMPLYRRNINRKSVYNGYEEVYSPKSGTWAFTHRLVAKSAKPTEYAEVERRLPLEDGKFAVVHHRNFKKTDNSPENLEWMTMTQHSSYHAKAGAANLVRYNRSPLKRKLTSEANRKYGKAEKMGLAYNGTPAHQAHNSIRRAAQLKSWGSSRLSRSQAMRTVIPQPCVDLALETLSSSPKLSRDGLYPTLLLDGKFCAVLVAANTKLKRNVLSLNPRVFAERLATICGVQGFSALKASYRNHSVALVETIQVEAEDVYCMTVVGANGEEDRHNFAASTFSGGNEVANSSIILKNSIDEDYFLPTRPNNQTKIESLAGGQNASATEDVEYILHKLIAALMVPKAYLTYDEAISCLVGETQIPLLDGTSPTIKELSDDFQSGKRTPGTTWCYSSLLDGTVVPGKVMKAWATKTADKTYQITLDNNETIECTENHPFLLCDGTYQRADELTVGTSLMSGPSDIFKENNIPGWREFQKSYLVNNHKVTNIVVVEHGDNTDKGVTTPWVYDLEVEQHHNFLVKQGVFVHNSKATLAQEDIRFSRTIANLQKIVIQELNKLAIIHLYSLGFSGDDLINYELKFSNPSTVAVQQKLALISSKIEIAGKALEISKDTGILSIPYIQREILGLRPEEVNSIKQESKMDVIFAAELALLAKNPPFDESMDSNIDIFDKANYKVPTSPFAPDKTQVTDIERQNHEDEREFQARRQKEREDKEGNPRGAMGAPISFSPTPNLDKSFRRNSRRKEFTGRGALALPDFKTMLDPNNRYARDPFGMSDLAKPKKFVLEEAEEQMQRELLGEHHIIPLAGIPKPLQSALYRMNEVFFKASPSTQSTSAQILESIEIVPETRDELFEIENELKSSE